MQEWSAEGYQLWMVRRLPDQDLGGDDGLDQPTDAVVLLDFVKSALTVNPCMVGSLKCCSSYKCLCFCLTYL